MTRFLFLFLAAIFVLASSARADDISVAGRGVVRVVTIASAEGQVVGFGHGSGFAISPTRIITNAHVVELAARYPANVIIGVVPSEGDKSYRGKLISYDAQRDLALIEFSGTKLPALTLFTGPVTDGEAVIALGYPGNVDVATAQSAADFIKPLSPVRSQGGFAGLRRLTSVDVLLHTAGIARGNSGGPLLDQCGRVIGVNSAMTKAEEGDSSFGFAVAESELLVFLQDAKQAFASIGAACTSAETRFQQQADAQIRAAETSADEARVAAQRTAAVQAEALETARIATERRRENFLAIAAVLLVLGALALGGAGFLEIRQQRRWAISTAVMGVLLFVVSGVVFFTRPFDPIVPTASGDAQADAAANINYGKLLCRLSPEKSRINLSSPKDIQIDWGLDGCADGKTQYAEEGKKWDRIVIPAGDQSVSVIQYDPVKRSYSESRYLLSAAETNRIRKLLGSAPAQVCSAGEVERQKLSRQQSTILSALPPRPDEWFVYDCAPTP